MLERGHVADAEDLELFCDALAEPRENLTGTDLERVRNALRDHESDRVFPADGPVDLPDEELFHARNQLARAARVGARR